MYQNYIFDLYGTLVDIHTNEKKAYLWKKMSLFFGMKGAAYEPKELRMAYETKIKEQEAALRMECRGSHVPEIDIADVFRQLFEDQAVSVTEEEIADLAKMFRAISIEELKLFPGVPEMLQRLKDAGKKVFLLSNAQALFTAPEISLLGLTRYFDGILLSSDAGVKSQERNPSVFPHSFIPSEFPIAGINQNTAYQPSRRITKCNRNDGIKYM